MSRQFYLKQLVIDRFEKIAGPFPRPTAALAWLIDKVHQSGKGVGTVSYERIPDSDGFDVIVTAEPDVIYQFLVEAVEVVPEKGGVAAR